MTQILNFFAVTIIAISIVQVLISRILAILDFPFFTLSNVCNNQKTNDKDYYGGLFDGNRLIRNLVGGLLMALEFESAIAIMKLGVFMTSITLTGSISSNIDNFLFFVSILTLRIAINQSLRRFIVTNESVTT